MFFLFGKKKDKSDKKSKETKVEKTLNIDEILETIESEKAKLESLSGKERIECLNKLGSLYFQANKISDAIEMYETSLGENKELGKAYTDLLKLYNIKRKEASDSKDEDQVKIYMDKINSLMQLSKDVIRGKA